MFTYLSFSFQMMFRFALLFALCLVAPALSAQNNTEKMTGLLWQISGNGAAKPGYLYGTMHVSEKLVFNLSDSFFIALRDVDMVALETDHDEWQQFTEDINSSDDETVFFQGIFGSRRNYQNLYNESFKFAAPETDLLGAILSSKPMMTNEFLYRSNSYRQEYEEDTYLDLFIFQAGRKLGKKVIGLETIEGSYEAAMRAQIPDDEEEKRNNRPYRGYFDASKMEEAYRNQDLTLLDSLNKISSPGKNFQRWMLDERNIVMANRIDSVLQSGTSLFSAVGAAHLPGEMGVIILLRNKGYTVRPVRFTATPDKKDKEQIDKIRFPAQLSTQWAHDSLWSTDAPGKFYPTANYQGFTQHLSADMNNGVFYAVYRMSTNGWWTGQSQAYIAERLDSLIYEKIPGKIQERKRIETPFPGHEITTRTRRGDVQRYKIFVTPFEVVMFTTGGNGDYAFGPEADRFLNNIRFSEKLLSVKNQPTTLRPTHGGYRVTFPATLLLNTTEDKKAAQHFAATQTPSDSAWYFLYRTEYHDWSFIEEDSFELNIIGEKIAEQFTKTPPRMTLVSDSPYPTQDVTFRSDRDSSFYFARLVIDGPHYYLLGSRNKTSNTPTAFFESFSIETTKYPEGWKDTKDTTLSFEVKALPVPERNRQAYLDNLKKIFEEGYRKRSRGYYGEEPDDPYEWAKNGTRIFKSPLTGEEVSVRSSEFRTNMAPPTRDSFEMEIQKRFSREQKMTIKESRWETRDSMLIGHFLLEDTNSTRGIRAKVVVAGKRQYILLATVNLQAPESEFVQSVFSSFTPTDTIDGPVRFGEGYSTAFLNNIYSPDTLTRNAALSEMRKFWPSRYKASDFSSLKATVEHPAFDSLKFSDRYKLLDAIGRTKSPAAIPWLRDFYRKNPDSVRYQATVLQSLSNLKTKEAFRTLLDLWLERPVYMRNSLTQVFHNLRDTLALTAHLFPDLLKFADIETNREQVLDLLNAAVKKGLVKPKTYAHLKGPLLRETAWYLSQLQVQEEEKRSSKKGSNDYNRYEYYAYGSSAAEATIERNFNLLGAFYQKDKEVQAIVERAVRFGNKPTQLLAYGFYLQNNIPVAPEKLKPFSEDDQTRYLLFEKLVKMKKVRGYTAWFKDTTALARSYIVGKGQPRGVDSVQFISGHRTVQHNKPATLYFFDVKREGDKEWGLASVVIPRDFGYLLKEQETSDGEEEVIYEEGEYSDYIAEPNYYYERHGNRGPSVQFMLDLYGKEKEEYISKKIGEMRFANRERYISTSTEGRYYYDGGGY
ncbi:MAG: TraB/GumN family protein [Saprospiraceae bacterium]|nr:TraB/GumN family protein [Saprospiraceae bacterium]